MKDSFHNESYALHATNVAATQDNVPSVIGRPDSIDALRHVRMYSHVNPLIDADKKATWLTVGDTGGDCHYLKTYGAESVTGSCISDAQLKAGQAQGLLAGIDVCAINAEQMEIEDNAFDYILCKEAYHHFPRPALGYYEMVRTCRKAAVFIEPAEPRGRKILDAVKGLIKSILRGKSAAHHEFEITGNYLFRLSEREITKQATAQQLHSTASLYMNDFYHSSISNRQVSNNGSMFLFRLGVMVQNILCRLRLMNYGLMVMIVFKQAPTETLSNALKAAGFTLHAVPRNPYLE